uniref:Si:ch211-12e13.12 n=2 Tax=Denticeps clupeoides TaxID=299321 RepID=A0AAY4CL14_9TELE
MKSSSSSLVDCGHPQKKDGQKVVYEVQLSGGAPEKNQCGLLQSEQENVAVTAPANGTVHSDVKEWIASRENVWGLSSDHQATGSNSRLGWTGPEDDLTEETSFDKSSSMSFLDSHIQDNSEGLQIRIGISVAIKTEIVLIDEDDDMSLREKTVADVSVTDGSAAQLVCGQLLSVFSNSTDSSSECIEGSLAAETPLPTVQTRKPHCCFCTIM